MASHWREQFRQNKTVSPNRPKEHGRPSLQSSSRWNYWPPHSKSALALWLTWGRFLTACFLIFRSCKPSLLRIITQMPRRSRNWQTWRASAGESYRSVLIQIYTFQTSLLNVFILNILVLIFMFSWIFVVCALILCSTLPGWCVKMLQLTVGFCDVTVLRISIFPHTLACPLLLVALLFWSVASS